MTQWLFGTQQCLCLGEGLSNQGHSADRQLCWTCLKPVPAEKSGTMTQWIFRSDSCRCAAPNTTAPGQSQVVLSETARLEQLAEPSEDEEPALEVFAERYKILSLIGTGADGSVYMARDKLLNKRVALKRLHRQKLRPGQIALLQQEARTASRLHHENLINVLDFGVAEDEPYLVMEFAPGKTLRDILHEHEFLPLDTALDIAFQISDALAHAHEKGIIHCDLNSGNIMIGNFEAGAANVKILDFGVAKFTTALEADASQKLRGHEGFAGSPFYISPEQARSENLDGRTDVYSLGCLLYEMLTGTPPFVGRTGAQTILMHLNDPVPALKAGRNDGNFPETVEQLIAKALAKSADERFSSMTEFCQALVAAFESLSESQGLRQTLTIQRKMPGQKRDLRLSKTKIYLSLSGILAMVTAAFYACYVFGVQPVKPAASSKAVSPNSVPAFKTASTDLPKINYDATHEENLSAISPEFFPDLRTKLNIDNDQKFDELVQGQLKARPGKVSLRSCSGITKRRLERLARIGNITSLELVRSDINDECIKVVARLPGLQQLFLNRCNLSSQSFHYLAEEAHDLSYLDASDTHLSDEGLQQICKIARLQFLDLNSNEGLHNWSLLNGLKKLRILDVGFTSFSDAEADLLDGLTDLEILSLREDPGVSSISLDKIARLRKLKDLNVANTSVSKPALLEALGKMHLDKLTVDNNQLSGKDALAYPNCKIIFLENVRTDKTPDLPRL